MNTEQLTRIESSFQAIAKDADRLVDRFYSILFETAPGVRAMFPDDLASQKKKLIAALAFVVGHLRKPEQLSLAVAELGARHAGYGAEDAHYPVVRDCMLEALSEVAGDLWTAELEHDWRGALDHIATLMIAGAAQARARRAA